MTNKGNLGNMNAEVQTEEEKKGAAIVDVPENIDSSVSAKKRKNPV